LLTRALFVNPRSFDFAARSHARFKRCFETYRLFVLLQKSAKATLAIS
jgi:hypothetical protein